MDGTELNGEEVVNGGRTWTTDRGDDYDVNTGPTTPWRLETFVSFEVAWNAVKSIEWYSLNEKIFEIYPVEKKKLFPTRVIYS